MSSASHLFRNLCPFCDELIQQDHYAEHVKSHGVDIDD